MSGNASASLPVAAAVGTAANGTRQLLILSLVAAFGGCTTGRDELRERPVEKWYTTAATFHAFETCMGWAPKKFGPMTVSNEANRRHLRFGDQLLVTLSPGPDNLTRVEVRTRDGYPPPIPVTPRIETTRQLVQSCL
jgi:hypothetical protein